MSEVVPVSVAHPRDMAATGAPDDAIDTAFRDLILSDPGNRLHLADWMDLLLKRESADAIVDRLVAIQAGAPKPLRSVLLMLKEMIGLDGLWTRMGDDLGRMRQAPPMLAIADAWGRHGRGADIPTELATAVLKAPASSAEIYFSILTRPPAHLALFDDRPGTRAALERYGIDGEQLAAAVSQMLTIDADHAERLAENFGGDEDRLAKVLETEARGFYKYRIIGDGAMRMRDPYAPAELDAIDSFRLFGRTVYTFRGEKLFYLICGNMGNDLLGLYVPDDDLTVTFASGAFPAAGLASFQVQQLSRICRAPDRFLAAYRRGGSPGAKRIVFHLEKTENFAHHLWNFYSSLDSAIAMGLVSRIDRVIFAGTEFFGPLEAIFPEIAAIGVERPRKNHVVDPCPFSETEILAGAGAMAMLKSLPQRVIEAMARRASPQPSPAERARGAFPVVWLGMRLGDKSWIDQERELPRIIDGIAAAYPDALFLLDGFSTPVGEGDLPALWASFRTRIAAIAEGVRRACGNPERVIDLVGNDLGDSVLWAAETDVYLAPLGTTQHKVGWFTSAPGIVYASPSFRDRAHRTPGAWAAAISPTPTFVIGEPAGAGERRGASRSRERMENVRLDTDWLLAELLRMIGAVAAERHAT